MGSWLSQFLDEFEKICNDLDKDLPDYDYHNNDDSFDGRVTMFPQKVSRYTYGYRNGLPFREGAGVEDGELDTAMVQFNLPIWMFLTPISLASGFVRLFR